MFTKDQILFSIIIPTYNRANLISKAIQSVIDQTYGNWELIIVDDGSIDNTEEVVRSFKEPRIKYFKKKHEERSIARNFGTEKANGTYLSFLDDDDYYLPEFLEEFNNSIESNYRPVSVFMSEELLKSGQKYIEKRLPAKLNQNKVHLVWEYEPGIRPIVIHQDILKEHKFPDEFHFGEDMHLLIRILLERELILIRKPLYIFCLHKIQGTSVKFIKNLHFNALNSVECLNDLILYNKNIFRYISKNMVYDKINHTVYGFSSAAMKAYDFKLFFSLIQKFSFHGSYANLIYYLVSLLLRFPFYSFKSIMIR